MRFRDLGKSEGSLADQGPTTSDADLSGATVGSSTHEISMEYWDDDQ